MVADAAGPARQVARALADRDGAILPLITGAEAQRADMLWRFCAEQTLTINTAAAGGNAELLAGVATAAVEVNPA
jgi:RHH-type proline utilization regulon transcriptional repressor/proline dehydrogenase/delta 1-pyrroline-5-carboxylate dehydrogenase